MLGFVSFNSLFDGSPLPKVTKVFEILSRLATPIWPCGGCDLVGNDSLSRQNTAQQALV
jgi:hypothetical protein